MRTIVVNRSMTGKRIDKAMRLAFPNVPAGAFHKAFRKKDIKVNGVRVKEDFVVIEGDSVDIYIIDSILDSIPQKQDDFKMNRGFLVVFEDSNLLIVDKDQGVPVHPDRDQQENTLIDLVKSYLNEKGEHSDAALCHRLDRNTGGLVIIAKNEPCLKIMLQLIKNKSIEKFYQCYVKGKMPKKSEELTAYLSKDEKISRVFVSDKKSPNSLEIITRYKVLDYNPDKDISKLEIQLITGRTHQIRAHMAYIGHPVIGDGKYGTNAINRPLGAKQQMLWAYKLVFDLKNHSMLDYLNGKVFQVQPRFQIRID